MLLLLFAACGGATSDLSAEDELTLSATAGKEEAMSGEGLERLADGEPPDPFRTCDAAGDLEALLAAYDADADGALGPPEEDEVHEARAGRGPDDAALAEMAWATLLLVYDLDGDGVLADSERATLLDDFTVRCEAMQALLLADFDADGDGALSDEEKDAARAALDEQMATGAPPEGAPPEGAPPEGETGECHGGPPPIEAEFDTDGDGDLSDAELATLRETARASIRAGEPFFVAPPPPPR